MVEREEGVLERKQDGGVQLDGNESHSDRNRGCQEPKLLKSFPRYTSKWSSFNPIDFPTNDAVSPQRCRHWTWIGSAGFCTITEIPGDQSADDKQSAEQNPTASLEQNQRTTTRNCKRHQGRPCAAIPLLSWQASKLFGARSKLARTTRYVPRGQRRDERLVCELAA